MLELKKKYTIIIVTHNMAQAQRVADRTAFMYMGEVIEYNETSEIFNHPKEELTANYVSGTFG
jgi:phosphate transport system ATP-binding protein